MRVRFIGIMLLLPFAGCATNQSGQPAANATASTPGSTSVVGLGGTEGEIQGRPAPGSKFSRVQIGMPYKQVTDIIGMPTDTSTHITGKAFIPFYFGGDTSLFEAFYKGEGQLSFAASSIGDSARKLVRVIVDPTEQGYAH